MDRRTSDWRTIVLAISAAGGALLAFSVAAILIISALMGRFQLELATARRSTLDLFVLASALLVIGAAFLPAAYYSIQQLRGGTVPAATPKLLRPPQFVLLILVWMATAAGAGYLVDNQIAKWITPVFYVLAIGVPAVFFARLATGGLHPGSRERLWGALAAGIGLGIAPAMIAEVLLAVVGLIGIGLYVALHPDQLSALQSLADQLRNSTDIQQVLTTAGPWLTSPIVLIAALLAFSVISPLIEEIAKSLTTWAVYDRLTSPAQGFAIGAMSGAAFGLVESLLVSSTPDASWTTTLLVRGASTMMHIMSASLTGWGIASLRTRKNIGMLIGMYLLAMGLHGAWNASVVAITFGSVRSALASSGRDPIGVILIALGVLVLAVLVIGIPLAMATINWRFRKMAAPVSTAPAEIWESSGVRAADAMSPDTRPRPRNDAPVANQSKEETNPPTPPASPEPEDNSLSTDQSQDDSQPPLPPTPFP